MNLEFQYDDVWDAEGRVPYGGAGSEADSIRIEAVILKN